MLETSKNLNEKIFKVKKSRKKTLNLDNLDNYRWNKSWNFLKIKKIHKGFNIICQLFDIVKLLLIKLI